MATEGRHTRYMYLPRVGDVYCKGSKNPVMAFLVRFKYSVDISGWIRVALG